MDKVGHGFLEGRNYVGRGKTDLEFRNLNVTVFKKRLCGKTWNVIENNLFYCLGNTLIKVV